MSNGKPRPLYDAVAVLTAAMPAGRRLSLSRVTPGDPGPDFGGRGLRRVGCLVEIGRGAIEGQRGEQRAGGVLGPGPGVGGGIGAVVFTAFQSGCRVSLEVRVRREIRSFTRLPQPCPASAMARAGRGSTRAHIVYVTSDDDTVSVVESR
jgi:hypothetical protein